MVTGICKLVILTLLSTQSYCFPLENDTHTVYDQKQSGKFNIHINIKDVAIIDVNSNEFIDVIAIHKKQRIQFNNTYLKDTINDTDEYYYDEDDLTIKPLYPWPSSTPYDTITYSPNYISSTKEPMHQLSPFRNESNTLNSTTLIHDTTVPSEEYLEQPATKPVLNHQNKSKNNIPHSSLKGIRQNIRLKENILTSKFQRKWKPNSNILGILSGQIFNKSNWCSSNYEYNNNRNCKKKKYSTLIKGLLGLMQLMKIKDN